MKNIFLYGSLRCQTYEETKRLILTNQIACVFSVLTLPYCLVFPLVGAPLLGMLVIPLVCSFSSTLLFNKVGLFNTARIILLSSLVIGVFVFASILGKVAGIQYAYFTVSCIAFIIFEPFQYVARCCGMVTPILGYFLLEILHYNFFIKEIVSDSLLFWIHLFVVADIFIILLLIMRFYYIVLSKTKFTLNILLKRYPLTQREVEIMTSVMQGKTNKEVSIELFIEETTVKHHLRRIFEKLNIKNRTQLVSFMLGGAP